MKFEVISIIGLGYIGLPTAALFASHKIRVIGVDVDKKTVDVINKGKVHIVEPDLAEAVETSVNNGYLHATTASTPADAFIIAVPTPFKIDSCDADLKYIEAASKSIARVLKKGDLVILESTSPVGTTEQMAEWLALLRPDITFPQQLGEDSDIRVAYCPERVLPGHVLKELVTNDRIIGGMTSKCSQIASALYSTFVKGNCIVTNTRTAELAKLTENSFRDVNIAFANELSMICDRLKIDVWELIELANRHPRVNILKPGPGVGGHCIAVDPWFIISRTPKEANLIRIAREVNESKPRWVERKIRSSVADFLQEHPNKTIDQIIIGCLGLTFKADIDDLRESPALSIAISVSQSHPGKTICVEPNIDRLPENCKNIISLCSLEELFSLAHVLVILVDHKEFLDFNSNIARFKHVVDTRGMLR